MQPRELDPHPPIGRWVPTAFVLVITALLGSVVLPALESSDVLTSLSDDQQFIEPARVASEQIESDIAEASTELQRYALFGDSASLDRLNRFEVHVAASMATLQDLTRQLSDRDVTADVKLLATRVEWWSTVTSLRAHEPRPVVSPGAVAQRAAIRESVFVATSRIQSDLAGLAARNRSTVVAHERRGVLVNATLVLAALLAMAVMVETTRRERRRSRQDSALRIAAEALTEAFSTTDAACQIAESAIEVFHGRSAYVLHIDGGDDDTKRVIASATAGDGEALPGLAGPFRGSVVERALELGRPLVIDVDIKDRTTLSGHSGGSVSVLVIPLGTSACGGGAVAVTLPPRKRFGSDDQLWAVTFGRLAQLAYEKVRLLEHAHAARSRLERAIESRNRLMRGFSHDVKNPLAAADGYAVLLEHEVDGQISDEQRQSLCRLRRGIRSALSLIDELHELARAETGNLTVHRELTDVTELVQSLGDEYRAAADGRGLALVVDIDADLPMPFTDASRIGEIVGNLLSNAIKYTDEGTVVLQASRQRSTDDRRDEQILIRVSDTGPGIPREKLGSVFEEFERLSDRHPGVGLGLAISKHVANAIGCGLDVTSELGKGSTFTLTIPLGVDDGERSAAVRDEVTFASG